MDRDNGAAVGEPCIIVNDLTVERSGDRVLTDVSFEFGPGTLVGVVGPNGAGKSTLFEAISGRIPIHHGSAVIRAEKPLNEGGVAYVPQRDSVNWRIPVTVQDVVMMGRTNSRGWLRGYNRYDKALCRQSLERVDLWDRRSSLMTELSGGQRQRAFIARALCQEASILLLDESFSGVDVGVQESIVDVLRELRDEGKIILLATHDLTNMALRFDICLCINRHVCACGPPAEAFTPEVLEELYGSHGVIFATASGETHSHEERWSTNIQEQHEETRPGHDQARSTP